MSSATGDGVDDEWAVVDSGVGEPAETIESVALTSAEPPGETSPAEASTDDTSAAATDDVPQRDTVTIERDPSDVERTVSYRERRQARMASTRGADAAEKKQRIRYRGSSSRSARAIAFAAVAIFLTVAFVVAAVLFAVGVGRQNDLDAQRSEYSSFASQFIVNMTSMNPSTVDNVLKTVQQDSSGRAKQQLQDSTQQAVGLVRDTNVETKTTVLSAAVTKAERDEGSVIMVFGWQQKSLDGKSGSQVQTFRWRVDMTRINGALKVTDFEWVA